MGGAQKAPKPKQTWAEWMTARAKAWRIRADKIESMFSSKKDKPPVLKNYIMKYFYAILVIGIAATAISAFAVGEFSTPALASWVKGIVGGGDSSSAGGSGDHSRPANKLATILGFPDPETLVRDLNKQFSKVPVAEQPAAVMKWVAESVPEKRWCQFTSFGPSGLVALHNVVNMNLLGKGYLASVDTLHLFPETYELIRAVKKRFGLESSLRIYRAKDASTREEFEKLYGAHLWRGDPHLFDFLTKVEPMHRALNDMNTMAWVTGRRKSQGGERSKLQIVELDAGDGRLKFNPLANWSGDQVWKYIKENKVPYNELHDKGYSSVGDMVTTEKTEPGKNEREGRFKGQNRTECGMHVATTGEGLEAMKKKAAIIAKGYKWELKERSHTESVGIVQITQENFEDMVATSQNNVLLEVYAPWCGHCQHFAPIYSKAGQLLINGKIKGDITVARMDGYQNKIPEQYQQMFPIKGFPTIFLHLKGSKEQPLVYDGQRHEAEALYNWVENHVSDHAAYN